MEQDILKTLEQLQEEFKFRQDKIKREVRINYSLPTAPEIKKLLPEVPEDFVAQGQNTEKAEQSPITELHGKKKSKRGKIFAIVGICLASALILMTGLYFTYPYLTSFLNSFS